MQLPDIVSVREQVEKFDAASADPALRADVAKLKSLSRERATKQQLLTLLERHAALINEQKDLQGMMALEQENQDMKDLAIEEVARVTAALSDVMAKLEELLIPRDPLDERDVIIEMRAGAGGEEAALFVAELFRAYSRYAELKGWRMHTLSTSDAEQGGYKEIIAELTGELVFGSFKFERGVHRVQRIPSTEKQGRIHTSTITVAVLPQAEEVDLVIRTEDLRIDTYRASGAGGQHVNKTSSAVRITHLPTNTVVAVQDERSQHKNREKAMSILRARLLAAQEEARHAAEAKERKEQVGTGDRSEKIRTYNFPQDRITDHRIKHSWSNIALVMEGEMEPIMQTMKESERAAKLANQ